MPSETKEKISGRLVISFVESLILTLLPFFPRCTWYKALLILVCSSYSLSSHFSRFLFIATFVAPGHLVSRLYIAFLYIATLILVRFSCFLLLYMAPLIVLLMDP